MNWINARERMPQPKSIVFVKANRPLPYNDVYRAAMLVETDGFLTVDQDFHYRDNCEWLDESPDSYREALEKICNEYHQFESDELFGPVAYDIARTALGEKEVGK